MSGALRIMIEIKISRNSLPDTLTSRSIHYWMKQYLLSYHTKFLPPGLKML